MTVFRRALAAVLLFACAPLQAAINYQDMWWKPTEAGWGLMVLQQEDTLSAVMFHYRPDRKPTWYLLSNGARIGETFGGELIETEGPPLFGAYNPATLVTRPVGTMSIAFSSSRAGVVTYTINGETASKEIERITFGATAFAGEYLGSQAGYASCPGTPSIDTFTFGTRITIGANSSVHVSLGNSLIGEPLECDWTGPFAQSGAILTGTGTWICKNINGQTRMTATWTVDEMRVIDKSVVMNYHAVSAYPSVNANCTERGVFSGVRR
jgi:hypothetical protein